MPERKTPQVRFKGFTDTWEQRKLGELGKARSGIGFPEDEQGGKEGIPFYKVSDMNNAGNEHEMTTANNYVTREQIARKGWNPIDEVPAIFFAKVGAAVLLNRKRLCCSPFLLDNNTMAYSIDRLVLDAGFAKTLFETIDLTSLVQVGALPSYSSGDVENLDVVIPKIDEQRVIGVYFKNIDHLITLHQRECERLQMVKKSMLENCFPKNGEKVPRFRFAGFTGDWEQRKLGEVATEMVAGGDIDKDLILDEGRYPVIANALTNDGIVGYYNEDYRIKAPAVTITGRGDVGHAKARIVHFTPVVRLLSLKSNHDVFFLENAINTLKIVIESTGVPQLTVPQLAKYEISFPKSLDEEEKIGAYFKQLDNLITLHQSKLEMLKKIKESMLGKILV